VHSLGTFSVQRQLIYSLASPAVVVPSILLLRLGELTKQAQQQSMALWCPSHSSDYCSFSVCASPIEAAGSFSLSRTQCTYLVQTI